MGRFAAALPGDEAVLGGRFEEGRGQGGDGHGESVEDDRVRLAAAPIVAPVRTASSGPPTAARAASGFDGTGRLAARAGERAADDVAFAVQDGAVGA